MAFDSVPWAVGGGADHSAELARTLAYFGTGGREGVLYPTHLAVMPLATPGQGVRVQPGACIMRNRATGGGQQSYVARMPTETILATTPNGPGGTRSDLIVARVENPWGGTGEPWVIPPDVENGPYIFTRVISPVPAGTWSLPALGLGYTGLALARIDYPVNASTVTTSMIKNLRAVINPAAVTSCPPDEGTGVEPRNYLFVLQKHAGADDTLDYNTDQTYTDWPLHAQWDLPIPEWGTRIEFDLRINNVQLRVADAWGTIRLLVNNVPVAESEFDFNYRDTLINPYRVTLSIGGAYMVPPALRGTTVTCKMQGRHQVRAPGDHLGDGSQLASMPSTYTTGLIFHQSVPVLV